MADFEPALAIVLEHEGGFSDHKNDPGGATNFGVSLRFLQSAGDIDADLDGYLDGDLDKDGDIDADDIRKMTRQEAGEVYEINFWSRYGYDLFDSQAVANIMLSLSVNVGPGRAHRLLQEAIQTNKDGQAIKIDGILGPNTRREANRLPESWLTTELKHQAANFYRSLAATKPPLAMFLRGWLNRAYS